MINRLLIALILTPVFYFSSFAEEKKDAIQILRTHEVIDSTAPLIDEPLIDTALWDDLPKTPIMMWNIEKDGHTIHLVGSLHLAPDNIYPLPAIMTNVFLESDTAVFEVDPRELGQEYNTKLVKIGTLPEGTKLRDLLDIGTTDKLETALKNIHMPAGALDGDRPWLAALKLTFSYMVNGPGVLTINNGIDRHFIALAKRNRKKIRGLESVDDQFNLFSAITEDVSIAFLEKTLGELNDLEAITAEMVDAWKNGDDGALWNIVNESFTAYPDVYASWIVKRNRAWVSTIEQLLNKNNRAFIVVGAAHVSGPDSLQEMLKANGYTVEQVTVTPLATAP